MSTNDKQKITCFFIYNLQNYQIFLPHPSKRNHFGIKSCSYHKSQCFCETLVRPVLTLCCFPYFHKLFETNFLDQNQNNVIETINCFVDQLSKKKYCAYYVSEHIKYYAQINEYCLNKNVCLNIV